MQPRSANPESQSEWPGWQQWPCHPLLSEFVDAYWTHKASSASPARILPDGCIDLIVELCGNRCSPSLVGSMTCPLEVGARRHVDVVAVRFTPGGAYALFGLQTPGLTDRREPWSTSIGSQSEVEGVVVPWFDADGSRLLHSDTRRRVMQIESWLLRLARRVPAERIAVGKIARACFHTPDRSIAELAATLGRSRQHLRRQVLLATGLPPKTLQRVGRFQRAMSAIRAGTQPNAALAAQIGYYDQAHLALEFRQLAGAPPSSLLQR